MVLGVSLGYIVRSLAVLEDTVAPLAHCPISDRPYTPTPLPQIWQRFTPAQSPTAVPLQWTGLHLPTLIHPPSPYFAPSSQNKRLCAGPGRGGSRSVNIANACSLAFKGQHCYLIMES